MARDLPHDEGQEEDNLLIEAVSLLVQRQRETEAWVAEQIDQAHERSVAAERHYAELETRLLGLEDQIDRLVRELEPGRGDTVAGQRLARLREQVEDLKSETDGRPLRSVPAPVLPPAPRAMEQSAPPPDRSTEAPAPVPHRSVQVDAASATRGTLETSAPPPPRTYEREVMVAPAARPASQGAGASLLEFMGPTPQDRFGVVLIFLGVVAVLYAVLTQLRLG
ncbi:MAG: hypothetical protein JO318_05925 [Chloroflexi bacterium]|nr:hypothetical protein [Chloroflexota bacterium]